MNKNIKLILSIATLVVILAGAFIAYNVLSKKYNDEGLNKSTDSNDREAAPDFTVTDLEGNEIKLSSFFGKPIVLNFWASWCPPCKAELPDFQNVYNEMKDDIVFLMVNMTDGERETIAKGSKYISDNKYTFPVYYDVNQEAAYNYSIRSIPTTLFIDKGGNIASVQQGMISESSLRKSISLINK